MLHHSALDLCAGKGHCLWKFVMHLFFGGVGVGGCMYAIEGERHINDFAPSKERET